MQIYFTGEDAQVIQRSRALRGSFLKNGYKLIRKLPRISDKNSLWFHGISFRENFEIPSEIIYLVNQYEGRSVFFQNSDFIDFAFHKIPESIATKISLFLRNHWRADETNVPSYAVDKTGFINPLIKPIKTHRGKPLRERSIPVMFYGSASGESGDSSRGRINAIRMIKNDNLPFTGGLSAQGHYPVPDELKVDALSQKEHNKRLNDTRICLALWGNCPLTYRLFEGLACRSLVITPSLSHLKFLSCNLLPGKHYVEVKPDLSDLCTKIRYYLEHPNEAQKIADSGFEHFNKNLQYSGVNFPQPLFKEMISTWHGLLPYTKENKVWLTLMNFILPHIKSL